MDQVRPRKRQIALKPLPVPGPICELPGLAAHPCEDEFAKRRIDFELLQLAGASEDDLAIANFMLWEFCRTGHDVERPASVEDLPYSFWPDSRKDAVIAATWEARHRDNWRSEREDMAEGEILPKAALPSPSPRLPGQRHALTGPRCSDLYFQPHADDWIRGDNPEEMQRAKVIASGATEQ